MNAGMEGRAPSRPGLREKTADTAFALRLRPKGGRPSSLRLQETLDDSRWDEPTCPPWRVPGWLTQQHMADLFQTSKQNIGQHLKNIFEEGDLAEDSVVKHFFTAAADGKDYRTTFYNLDVIISVGYRVKSAVATRFRIWATQKLREFIVKGFVLDDERLKNPEWDVGNSRITVAGSSP
jgi:hypothetical protein